MISKILIVDDDPLFTEQIAAILTRENYPVVREHKSARVMDLLQRENIDLILLDIQMPAPDGIELLKRIKKMENSPAVIMFSGAASLQQAADSIKLGALDFLEKPPDVNRLLITLKNSLERSRLERENRNFRNSQLSRFEIIGKSPAIVTVRETIRQVAKTDSRILIWGETGTGKELAAAQIHYNSRRSDRALVMVNCASIPEELAESELYGHKKGAFTGAYQDKPGKFTLADNGTLVLDEITELSLNHQSKLLRALESAEIEIVGGTATQKVDVRLISISGKNIEDLAAQRKFREDLYYRINTIPIHIPPLRERREDIQLLTDHFFNDCNNRFLSDKPVTYTPDLIARLTAYDWPGNIRQLKNCIERMIIMARGEVVRARDAEAVFGDTQDNSALMDDDNPLKNAVNNFERSFLKTHLDKTSGNIAELAKILNLDRGNLYKKLKKYNLV